MINICVYCSSSSAIPEIYFKSAQLLGELIGKNNYTLINGGGATGLMGKTSEYVKKNGGSVIGIIPEALNRDGIVDTKNSDKMIITKNMYERKAKMEALADAFIALPGGFGTLEELTEIITLKQLHYHNKPIAILNINNYFQGLIEQFEKGFNENFAKTIAKRLYLISESEIDTIDYIKNYKPENHIEKWY